MKHFTLVVLFVAGMLAVNAQNHLYETFTTGSWPPAGWTIDAQAGNWSKSTSANAGADSPEARFTWQPQFNGYSRLISPAIDLTGLTALALEFNHMVDHYGGPYTLGAATRSGGGTWNIIWQMTGTSTPPSLVSQMITNTDVGAADFQFCLFFNGASYNINDWYIDNIRLFTPFDHDVAVMAIKGGTYFNANDAYAAKADIRNAGLNTETFDATVTIKNLNNDVLYTNTQTITALASGATTEVNFDPYTLTSVNDAYLVEIETQLTNDESSDNNMKSKYIYTYTTAKSQIVMEIGTGTWCQYCPGAAMGAHDLQENGYNVAVIKYHSGDSYEIPASASRVSYYGITGFPTAIFDGVDALVGGSATESLYDSYVPMVDARNLIRTAFNLTFDVPVQNASDYSVTVMVDKLGPALQSNLKLHFVLTESHIPQNWFNQTEVNNVTRLMLPSANGLDLDMSNIDHFENTYTVTTQSGWSLENLELVIFIQDNATKEILNASKIMLTELISGINDGSQLHIADLGIYPNPVTTEAQIHYAVKDNSMVNITLYDINGRLVEVLASEYKTKGEYRLKYSPSAGMKAGVYFVSLKTDDSIVTKKMIVN